MRKLALGLVVVGSLTSCQLFEGEKEAKKGDAGWVSMFDGKTMTGWKVNESPESWSVKDGAIVANGNRSHLFYVADPEPFVNFEFEATIMTRPGSNSGIYFHTAYLDSGWPKYGYECQVNNSQADPQRTAGLYETAKVFEAPAKDDAWFTMGIKVQGKRVTVTVDGKVVTDYTEPEGKQPGADYTRVLDKGTFALQAHDPGSTVLYKDLKVRRLP